MTLHLLSENNMKSANTISGIDIIGDLPWGTHFCQFYHTKEDLMDILIPYFKAGLENNEFCLWVISEQLNEGEAKKALKVAIPDIDAYLKNGQIEIVPYACLHVEKGALDPQMVLNRLIEKTSKALASGYDGLRYSGNDFCDHEKLLDSIIGKYPVIALCTYPIDKCSSIDIIEIAANHQFALGKKKGKWERIESSGKKNINNCEQTEKALKDSKDSYKAIFDNSLDGIFITIPDGTILAANPAACQMFGMTEEEIIQAGRNGTVDTSDPRLKYVLEERDRTGMFKGELNHKRKDGTIFPSEISSTLFKDKNGLTKGVMIIRDITERKQVEEALRESEEGFCTLVTASSEMVYRVSPDWSEMRYFYGRGFLANTESPNPTWLHEYVLSEDQQRVTTIINEAIRTKRTYQTEHRVRLADGSLGWIFSRAVPMLDANGEIVEWFGAASDITKRKEAEEALRLSNLYNRSLIEASLDPLVTIGRDGKITDVNGATEQVTGYSRNELIGTDFSDYFTEPVEARAGYQQVFIDGEVRDYPLEIQHKDGHITPVLYHASVYRDENRKVIGVFAAARDITERKKIEAKLKETLDNLDKLVKERTAELQTAYDSLKKSEKSLAEAQEMAHVGNWERDFASNEYSWSDEMYRIFGLKPQESKVNYHTFLNYVHPDDRDYIDNAVKEALKGKPLDINFRIILANGEERIVHAKAEVVFDEKNNPVRIRGTTQDITEHRKAEERIQNLANVVESSTEAIITKSFDGVITSWNKGAEQVYGYSAEEVLGKPISILEPPILTGETEKLSERD